MNIIDKIRFSVYKFWLTKVIAPYHNALAGWGWHDYKNSWKFKERWQNMGLEYASDFDKHVWDIQYHMKNCPKLVKLHIFIDSMVLRIPPEKVPYYTLS